MSWDCVTEAPLALWWLHWAGLVVTMWHYLIQSDCVAIYSLIVSRSQGLLTAITTTGSDPWGKSDCQLVNTGHEAQSPALLVLMALWESDDCWHFVSLASWLMNILLKICEASICTYLSATNMNLIVETSLAFISNTLANQTLEIDYLWGNLNSILYSVSHKNWNL